MVKEIIDLTANITVNTTGMKEVSAQADSLYSKLSNASPQDAADLAAAKSQLNAAENLANKHNAVASKQNLNSPELTKTLASLKNATPLLMKEVEKSVGTLKSLIQKYTATPIASSKSQPVQLNVVNNIQPKITRAPVAKQDRSGWPQMGMKDKSWSSGNTSYRDADISNQKYKDSKPFTWRRENTSADLTKHLNKLKSGAALNLINENKPNSNFIQSIYNKNKEINDYYRNKFYPEDMIRSRTLEQKKKTLENLYKKQVSAKTDSRHERVAKAIDIAESTFNLGKGYYKNRYDPYNVERATAAKYDLKPYLEERALRPGNKKLSPAIANMPDPYTDSKTGVKRYGGISRIRRTPLNESNADYMYHVTNAEAIKRIEKTGLIPRKPRSSISDLNEDKWEDGSKEARRYFSHNLQDAYSYVGNNATRVTPVSLRIKTPKEFKVPKGKEIPSEVFSTKKIPLKDISYLDPKGNWKSYISKKLKSEKGSINKELLGLGSGKGNQEDWQRMFLEPTDADPSNPKALAAKLARKSWGSSEGSFRINKGVTYKVDQSIQEYIKQSKGVRGIAHGKNKTLGEYFHSKALNNVEGIDFNNKSGNTSSESIWKKATQMAKSAWKSFKSDERGSINKEILGLGSWQPTDDRGKNLKKNRKNILETLDTKRDDYKRAFNERLSNIDLNSGQTSNFNQLSSDIKIATLDLKKNKRQVDNTNLPITQPRSENKERFKKLSDYLLQRENRAKPNLSAIDNSLWPNGAQKQDIGIKPSEQKDTKAAPAIKNKILDQLGLRSREPTNTKALTDSLFKERANNTYRMLSGNMEDIRKSNASLTTKQKDNYFPEKRTFPKIKKPVFPRKVRPEEENYVDLFSKDLGYSLSKPGDATKENTTPWWRKAIQRVKSAWSTFMGQETGSLGTDIKHRPKGSKTKVSGKEQESIKGADIKTHRDILTKLNKTLEEDIKKLEETKGSYKGKASERTVLKEKIDNTKEAIAAVKAQAAITFKEIQQKPIEQLVNTGGMKTGVDNKSDEIKRLNNLLEEENKKLEDAVKKGHKTTARSSRTKIRNLANQIHLQNTAEEVGKLNKVLEEDTNKLEEDKKNQNDTTKALRGRIRGTTKAIGLVETSMQKKTNILGWDPSQSPEVKSAVSKAAAAGASKETQRLVEQQATAAHIASTQAAARGSSPAEQQAAASQAAHLASQTAVSAKTTQAPKVSTAAQQAGASITKSIGNVTPQINAGPPVTPFVEPAMPASYGNNAEAQAAWTREVNALRNKHYKDIAKQEIYKQKNLAAPTSGMPSYEPTSKFNPNDPSTYDQSVKNMEGSVEEKRQRAIDINKEEKAFLRRRERLIARDAVKQKYGLNTNGGMTGLGGSGEGGGGSGRGGYLDSQAGGDRAGSFFNRMKSVGEYTIAAMAVRGGFSGFTKAVGTIANVQGELQQLNKVLNITDKQLESLKQSALTTAKEFGKSTTEVLSGYKVFAQMGKSPEEVKSLGRTVALASNVSTLGTEELSTTLATTMTNFKKSVGNNSQSIIDSVLAVEGASAVSEKDLFEVLRRVGPQAAGLGMSTHEVNALTTVIKERTMAPAEEIATSMRFMLRNLSSPKIGKKLEGMFGKDAVQFFTPTGDINDTFKVFQNLAKLYPTLNKGQQTTLAGIVSETRHLPKFNALMQGFSRTTDVMSISQNSSGEAIRRNAIIMQDVRVQASKTGAAFEAFSVSFGSNLVGPVSSVLKVLEKTLNVAEKLSNIKLFGGKPADTLEEQGLTPPKEGFMESLRGVTGGGSIGGIASLLSLPATLVSIRAITRGASLINSKLTGETDVLPTHERGWFGSIPKEYRQAAQAQMQYNGMQMVLNKATGQKEKVESWGRPTALGQIKDATKGGIFGTVVQVLSGQLAGNLVSGMISRTGQRLNPMGSVKPTFAGQASKYDPKLTSAQNLANNQQIIGGSTGVATSIGVNAASMAAAQAGAQGLAKILPYIGALFTGLAGPIGILTRVLIGAGITAASIFGFGRLTEDARTESARKGFSQRKALGATEEEMANKLSVLMDASKNLKDEFSSTTETIKKYRTKNNTDKQAEQLALDAGAISKGTGEIQRDLDKNKKDRDKLFTENFELLKKSAPQLGLKTNEAGRVLTKEGEPLVDSESASKEAIKIINTQGKIDKAVGGFADTLTGTGDRINKELESSPKGDFASLYNMTVNRVPTAPGTEPQVIDEGSWWNPSTWDLRGISPGLGGPRSPNARPATAKEKSIAAEEAKTGNITRDMLSSQMENIKKVLLNPSKKEDLIKTLSKSWGSDLMGQVQLANMDNQQNPKLPGYKNVGITPEDAFNEGADRYRRDIEKEADSVNKKVIANLDGTATLEDINKIQKEIRDGYVVIATDTKTNKKTVAKIVGEGENQQILAMSKSINATKNYELLAESVGGTKAAGELGILPTEESTQSTVFKSLEDFIKGNKGNDISIIEPGKIEDPTAKTTESLLKFASFGFGAGQVLRPTPSIPLAPTRLSEMSDIIAGSFQGYDQKGTPRFSKDTQEIIDSISQDREDQKTMAENRAKGTETSVADAKEIQLNRVTNELSNAFLQAVSSVGKIKKAMDSAAQRMEQFAANRAAQEALPDIGPLQKYGGKVPGITLSKNETDLNGLELAYKNGFKPAMDKLEEISVMKPMLRDITSTSKMEGGTLNKMISRITDEALSVSDTKAFGRAIRKLLPLDEQAIEEINKANTDIPVTSQSDLMLRTSKDGGIIAPNKDNLDRKTRVTSMQEAVRDAITSWQSRVSATGQQMLKDEATLDKYVKTGTALEDLAKGANDAARSIKNFDKFGNLFKNVSPALGEGPFGKLGAAQPIMYSEDKQGNLVQKDFRGMDRFQQQREMTRLLSSPEYQRGDLKLKDEQGNYMSPITETQAKFQNKVNWAQEDASKSGIKQETKREQLKNRRDLAASSITNIQNLLDTVDNMPKEARSNLQSMQRSLLQLNKLPERAFYDYKGEARPERLDIVKNIGPKMQEAAKAIAKQMAADPEAAAAMGRRKEILDDIAKNGPNAENLQMFKDAGSPQVIAIDENTIALGVLKAEITSLVTAIKGGNVGAAGNSLLKMPGQAYDVVASSVGSMLDATLEYIKSDIKHTRVNTVNEPDTILATTNKEYPITGNPKDKSLIFGKNNPINSLIDFNPSTPPRGGGTGGGAAGGFGEEYNPLIGNPIKFSDTKYNEVYAAKQLAITNDLPKAPAANISPVIPALAGTQKQMVDLFSSPNGDMFDWVNSPSHGGLIPTKPGDYSKNIQQSYPGNSFTNFPPKGQSGQLDQIYTTAGLGTESGNAMLQNDMPPIEDKTSLEDKRKNWLIEAQTRYGVFKGDSRLISPTNAGLNTPKTGTPFYTGTASGINLENTSPALGTYGPTLPTTGGNIPYITAKGNDVTQSVMKAGSLKTKETGIPLYETDGGNTIIKNGKLWGANFKAGGTGNTEGSTGGFDKPEKILKKDAKEELSKSTKNALSEGGSDAGDMIKSKIVEGMKQGAEIMSGVWGSLGSMLERLSNAIVGSGKSQGTAGGNSVLDEDMVRSMILDQVTPIIQMQSEVSAKIAADLENLNNANTTSDTNNSYSEPEGYYTDGEGNSGIPEWIRTGRTDPYGRDLMRGVDGGLGYFTEGEGNSGITEWVTVSESQVDTLENRLNAVQNQINELMARQNAASKGQGLD